MDTSDAAVKIRNIERELKRELVEQVKRLADAQEVANQLAAYALSGCSDQEEIAAILRGGRVI